MTYVHHSWCWLWSTFKVVWFPIPSPHNLSSLSLQLPILFLVLFIVSCHVLQVPYISEPIWSHITGAGQRCSNSSLTSSLSWDFTQSMTEVIKVPSTPFVFLFSFWRFSVSSLCPAYPTSWLAVTDFLEWSFFWYIPFAASRRVDGQSC